jgi:GTP cyclohydrolase I
VTPSTSASAVLRRQTDRYLVESALDLLLALRALDACLEIRDMAVAAAARRSCMSVRQVGKHIRSTLAEAGFTEEEITRLGVSDANIRLITLRT